MSVKQKTKYIYVKRQHAGKENKPHMCTKWRILSILFCVSVFSELKVLTRYMERSILRELCSWSRSLTNRSLWKDRRAEKFHSHHITHICTRSYKRQDREWSSWSQREYEHHSLRKWMLAWGLKGKQSSWWEEGGTDTQATVSCIQGKLTAVSYMWCRRQYGRESRALRNQNRFSENISVTLSIKLSS